jgi:anti-sigma factor RsiW
MNECPNNLRLSAHHDGELDESGRAEVEQHLRDCPSCASDLEKLRAMSRLFASQEAPRLLPIAVHRLHKKVDNAMEEGLLRIMRVFNAIAACVLIAGSAWLMMKPREQDRTVERAVATPAVPPWVNVENISDTPSGAYSTPAAAWYLADDTSHTYDTP